MKEEIYYVITFDSTHHAIKGEKDLKRKGLDIRTIPTPREVSASCGLSIKFNIEDLDQIQRGIKEKNLPIEGIYRIFKKDHKKSAKKVKG